MASTVFSVIDYERLLSLAGSQRGLFDTVGDNGLSDTQNELNGELIRHVCKAKAFDLVRTNYLDFAFAVYSRNFALIQGAMAARIGVEGLNMGAVSAPSIFNGDEAPSEASEQEIDSIELVGSTLEEPESVAASLRGDVPNPLGVSFFYANSTSQPVSKVSKSDALEFFMDKALSLGVEYAPRYMLNSGLPRSVFASPSYSDFLSLSGEKPLNARLSSITENFSPSQIDALSHYKEQLQGLVSTLEDRAKQLFGWMVRLSASEDGQVKSSGLSFYLNETLEGQARAYFLSEINGWFLTKAKLFGLDLRPFQGDPLDAQAISEPTPQTKEFLFDGVLRTPEDTVWSEAELREYKSQLESGVKAQAEQYREALDAEKESLIELYGAEGIKEKALDIGTLAIEALEARGIFAPENVKRKVFAVVPDFIKAMNDDLTQILERKAQAEEINPWDDFEDEEAQALFKKTVATLKWAVSNARIQVAYSGGKDSTIVLYALLKALKQNQVEGVKNFPVRVISSDTLLENPEITNNLHMDHAAITKWAMENHLDIECKIATPALLSQYQVAQVGGRKLHNMPNKSSECSRDWKVQNMVELRHAWRKEVNGDPIITVTGTRLEESIHRGNAMRKREDSDEKITVSDSNELIMSPIASMSSNHVFKLLDVHLAGEIAELKQKGVQSKDWPYPTDGTRTQRIYKDAASSSCEIVNTQIAASKATGCGARTGCWNCQRVKNDTSAENMLKNQPSGYAFMAPLLRYRKWVSDMHDDPASRSFVGRSIDTDGLLKFGHDNYHPRVLQDMLRYLLTMQVEHDEIIAIQREADPSRDYPELMIFNVEQLISVQYEWSRYGREAGHPFEALRIFNEVYNEGKRFYPPVLGMMETAKIAPLPAAPSNGFISVGKPFVDYNPENMSFINESGSGLTGFSQANQGLQDALLEMASFEASKVHQETRDQVTGSTSRYIQGLDEANRFEVDLKAATDFIAYEMPRQLAMAESNPPPVCAGHAAKVLLQFGVIKPRNVRAQHELISQYQYLESRNLTPATYDHQACLKLLVDRDGQPVKDKRAFTLEHYYLDDEKANKRMAENRDILAQGRSKNTLGQPNAAFMPKDQFNKYRSLEVQLANNRVLMEVNKTLSSALKARKNIVEQTKHEDVKKVLGGLEAIQSLQKVVASTRNNGQTQAHLTAREKKEAAMSNLVDTVQRMSASQTITSGQSASESLSVQTMREIAASCEKGAEIENDIAGIEVQRRMLAQQEGQQIQLKPVTFQAMRV